MEIYGLGIIAACMFVGVFVGSIFAKLLGVSGDVGGVGIAMLLLVLVSNYIKLDEKTQNGIKLISNLYIPIIVAMAATQDVVKALSGGAVAFLAGGVATVASFFLVPLLSRIGKGDKISQGREM
ncbi:MAG: malonate transporter subunit MadL [Bacillota bacterium]|jgi:malonate transporter MadL subunit|uniref:Malonate transporter subunit MadL n=1 Tax=Thermanaerosceptrum fracticalcis TaxID=1712410 RepID=A0A7G6DZB0_THEFR|nr:malonate transporter subunit MadL [Thermanaerosceptrum fracticalcis]QNB45164.1 malonate transporter subunit MadL [Thermanaerosceptrum fracticalcis]